MKEVQIVIKIQDKSMCSGCSACYSVCPKNCFYIVEDEEGFLYPKTHEALCINCGLCDKVCPINEDNNFKNGVLFSCIIQHKDEDILRQSTSGGGFTPIAEYVLNKGGVVFGVEMQHDDFFVKHSMVETTEDLRKFRSSKYVQSFIGDTFKRTKEELTNGKIVCFSGTPCQIQGLKNYLGSDYENLITVDVVCRCVPSPGIWKKYSEYLRVKGEVEKVVFRDKDLGYQYSTMKVKYRNGEIERNGIESDQWLRMFFSGMIIRPSCPKCNFRTTDRCSDFTIWDCFNVSDLTNKLDETKGATRMLIHSQKGLEIFERIIEKYYVVYSTIQEVSDGIADTVCENKKKKEFIKDYNNMNMTDLLNKWFPMSSKVKLKKHARKILNKIGLDLFLKKLKRKLLG